MRAHRNLDRLIVLASILGLLSPIARGSAAPIVDTRAEGGDPLFRATSPGCLVTEPRFPIVVRIPVASSTASIASDLGAEVTPVGVAGLLPSDVDVDVMVAEDGRATAMVTWWGDASKRRAPVGVYDVIVTSSSGRSTTCVAVARPPTTKAVDRMRPPEDSVVEVIVIGRSERRGGMS